MLKLYSAIRTDVGTFNLSLTYNKKNAIFSIIFRLLGLLFFVYFTFFVAVSTPFFSKHSLIVYFVGFFISFLYLIRFSLCLFLYFRSILTNLSIIGGYFILKKESNIVLKCRSENISRFSLIFGDFLFIDSSNDNLNSFFLFPLAFLQKKDKENFRRSFNILFSPGEKIQAYFATILEVFVVSLAIALHIICFIVGNYYIPTNSMSETIIKGDWVLAEKFTYGIKFPKFCGKGEFLSPAFLQFSTPKRGDIVIFVLDGLDGNENKKIEYVKRCIALSGDDVKIENNAVYVNGKMLEEDYACGKTTYKFFEEGKIDGIVPENCIVVLGDNREDSRDSREFGYVKINNVIGRVFLLYNNFYSFTQLDFKRFGFVK